MVETGSAGLRWHTQFAAWDGSAPGNSLALACCCAPCLGTVGIMPGAPQAQPGCQADQQQRQQGKDHRR